jgi:hypothetical protein
MKKITFAYSTDRVDTTAAAAKPNRRIDFDELRAIITGKGYPASYLELPPLAKQAYSNGDQLAIDRLRTLKKDLPYFLASGFCPKHHDDTTLEYNGVLQIDVDFKSADGDQLAIRVLETIKRLRPAGVLLATLSPSTFGVKILLLTDNQDKGRHREALQEGIQYLAEMLQVDRRNFDTLGASQPVYIPFEREPGQAFFNDSADPLQIEFKQQHADSTTANVAAFDSELVRDAAQFLIDQQTSVAECYDEYLRILAACKNAFGDDGLQIATDLLNNSAAFRSSNFSKIIKGKFQRLQRSGGKMSTGATLVWLAAKNGFTGHCARNTTVLQANGGEYLTDVLDRYGIPLIDVCGKSIIAPTGSGKTTMIAQLVQRYPDRRFILVLPLKATINQFCKANPHATKYTGGSRAIKGDERLLVTTIQSFPSLATRVDLKQYDVFFDESHGLTADTSRPYKLDDVRKFHRVAKLAKSVAYLTGTPLYNFHPDIKDLERLEIRQPARVPRNASFIACDNLLASAVAAIKKSVERGNAPLLLLNDKGVRLAEIKTALAEYNLAVLNADAKDDPTFKEITTDGTIPGEIAAIVTTTVLREGNSIYDQRPFDVIVVGQFHSSTIAQITARPRTAAKVDVYLLRSKKRQVKDYSKFSPWNLARLYQERATRHCDEYNNQDGRTDGDEWNIFCEQNLRDAMQTDPVYLDDDGRLVVCPFELSNLVYQAETGAEYSDDRLMARNLRRYGFTIDGEHVAYFTGAAVITRTVSVDHDPETKQQIQQARGRCKEEKEKAHQDALNALQSSISPGVLIQQAEKANRVPAAYKWVKRLVDVYGLTWQAAIALLRDTNTGKKFRLLENQICAEILRNNSAYMTGDRLLAIQLLAIRKHLKPGKRYTADDLRRILVDNVLALDRSLYLESWRPDPADEQERIKVNRRAIALLRVFFDVEESGRPGARSCPRVREYYLKEITKFHGHGITTNRSKSNTYTENDLRRLESPIFAAATDDECPF